jgi:hypothetical protein
VSRCDTAREFVWRVRNVPYPSDVFAVAVEPETRDVVVRTTNKKFFKRLKLPEMDAAGLPLSPAAMTWHHAASTLVISYRKPPEVLAAEQQEQARRGSAPRAPRLRRVAGVVASYRIPMHGFPRRKRLRHC